MIGLMTFAGALNAWLSGANLSSELYGVSIVNAGISLYCFIRAEHWRNEP